MNDDLTDEQVQQLRVEEKLARWQRDRDRLPASCQAKHPPKADPELRGWMERLVQKLMRGPR